MEINLKLHLIPHLMPFEIELLTFFDLGISIFPEGTRSHFDVSRNGKESPTAFTLKFYGESKVV